MTKTILGIFQEREHLEMAIDELKEKGLNPQDISIVMKDTREAKEIGEDTGVGVAEGTLSGATTGAILGGLAGLLAAAVIPGLGAFFIGGPIAASLGLTGAAASTASGAATGALAGGLLGALMSWGLSEDEAKEYETSVKSGAILLAVPAQEAEESSVKNILQKHHAQNIRSINTQQGEDRFETRTSTKRIADDEIREERQSFDQPVYATAAKGGKSSSDDKGWHGDSKGHSEAAKKSSSDTQSKGGRSSQKSKGRGWHGDSEAHAKAARGEDIPGRGEGK